MEASPRDYLMIPSWRGPTKVMLDLSDPSARRCHRYGGGHNGLPRQRFDPKCPGSCARGGHLGPIRLQLYECPSFSALGQHHQPRSITGSRWKTADTLPAEASHRIPIPLPATTSDPVHHHFGYPALHLGIQNSALKNLHPFPCLKGQSLRLGGGQDGFAE